MGDRLRDLLAVPTAGNSSWGDAMASLTALVDQMLRHTGFSGVTQQDAAECLMHIAMATDSGRMQHRVCGACAAVSPESNAVCQPVPEASESRDAPPVSVVNMLVGSLADERPIQTAPLALVVRAENDYEQGEHMFTSLSKLREK